jgi:radical SAM superfamily enzyme YgiQ (UPF0313 family)
MNKRLQWLAEQAPVKGARFGLVSMYDVENNAVRTLAAVLREGGHHCSEIYFKDWISNHLDPASDRELDSLIEIIEKEQLNLVCLSIRASAYFHQARILSEAIIERLGVPVLWGGMHPTIQPTECMSHCDVVLRGEGEGALLDFAGRLRDGATFIDCPNLWLEHEGQVVENKLEALVSDLDDIPFRDYTTHDHKFTIRGKGYKTGDPMRDDPVFQIMGSRGCIYKCSYCYNSTYKKDVYAGQKWYRVRSPESIVEEIKQAQTHWEFKRVRFDDEVFNFRQEWIERFAELYPKEIGLPFEIFIEPKLVHPERMRLLANAGMVGVYMGIQSSERVTGHLYDRRVKNSSINDIADLFHELGVKPHFQLIWDDPVSDEEDKANLFAMIADFPHPYDLYLFSMTVFPSSELDKKLIDSGIISEYDVEGMNTRTFYQHRVNLKYPRPVEETFWIALTQCLSKSWFPRPVLRTLSRSSFLKKHPWPLIQMAHTANYIKMGSTAVRMTMDGEMTPTLMRRWFSFDRVITT